MKTILALSLLVIGSLSYAKSSECQQEAQIIAQVKAVESKSLYGCTVSVTDIKLYNESQVCALFLDDVLASGVEVGLKNGHDCRLEAGDMLTGILFKNADGVIILE